MSSESETTLPVLLDWIPKNDLWGDFLEIIDPYGTSNSVQVQILLTTFH
jgi:hypothetical protein